MKVQEFLEKWYDKKIEDDGVYTSEEYKKFQSEYRSVLKEIGKIIGFSLHSFSKNHYEFSAVMQSKLTQQFYYISISDVRCWKNEWANKILYRTMQHDKDWTGGTNRYSTLEELSKHLSQLDKEIMRNFDNKKIRQNNQIEKQTMDSFDFKYV